MMQIFFTIATIFLIVLDCIWATIFTKIIFKQSLQLRACVMCKALYTWISMLKASLKAENQIPNQMEIK